MRSLLNRTAVKEYVLATAAKQRGAAGFTRVSKAFLDKLEARLVNNIKAELHQQPTKGTTI